MREQTQQPRANTLRQLTTQRYWSGTTCRPVISAFQYFSISALLWRVAVLPVPFPATAQVEQIPAKPPVSQRIETRQAVGGAVVPNRPEKLSYPELNYQPPRPEDYRVALKSGPVAYVVEDRELPLLNVVVYVKTGEYNDPAEKSGLAELAGYLIARGGTATRTAEDLEERLAFLAARLDSGVGDTQGSVSLNLLSKDTAEGLKILREVLTAPRFQEDKVALRKQQLFQAMQQRNDDSSAIEARETAYLAFGEDFWSNRKTTPKTIDAIDAADLKSFHQAWFWPSNFVVAVNGDFERAKMIQELEKLFADWPFTGRGAMPIPTNTHFASPGAYILDKDVNQGRVTFLLPGITREHPDFFAVSVMNDILGGGGFTSRIMNRVRSDEGLAYSAFSRFPGGVYFPLTFSAGFQTKSRTVPYASSIVLEEITRVASTPVEEYELTTSKNGFIERFPRTFATKTQVANQFAQDEFTGRYPKYPDYWQKYRSRIESVTREEVRRVGAKYLGETNQLVVVIVGQKEEVLRGHPNHAVQLKDLVNGKITDLPQRNPLTLEPVSSQSN